MSIHGVRPRPVRMTILLIISLVVACTGYFAHPDISNIRILLLCQLKSGSCDGSGGLLPADN